uniref:Metalloendopeptidase n=1 Tax=Ceriantheomorphe brasiliensis TaxID=1048506 RepID=A0A7G7WYR1_9CNID|nr:toxin candidate TRINITY_DN17053_c0_g1_i1 [Ceriantheomorphe brasiliensis]
MKFITLFSLFAFTTLCSTVSSLPSRYNQASRTDQAVIKRPKGVVYWPDGEVPYTLSSLLSQPARKAIRQALKVYKRKTCITFVPRISQENYVAFVPGQGCYSAVGQQGGRQEITISSRCETKGTILHEIMHALGFHHEQSRYDREIYVKILWWNIEPGAEKNFEVNSEDEQDTFNLTYDYDSILHYNKKAYSKNNENTIESIKNPERQLGSFDRFSSLDMIKLEKVYCVKAHAPKEECRDLKPNCKKYIQYKSYCTANKDSMKIICPESCGFC